MTQLIIKPNLWFCISQYLTDLNSSQFQRKIQNKDWVYFKIFKNDQLYNELKRQSNGNYDNETEQWIWNGGSYIL